MDAEAIKAMIPIAQISAIIATVLWFGYKIIRQLIQNRHQIEELRHQMVMQRQDEERRLMMESMRAAEAIQIAVPNTQMFETTAPTPGRTFDEEMDVPLVAVPTSTPEERLAREQLRQQELDAERATAPQPVSLDFQGTELRLAQAMAAEAEVEARREERIIGRAAEEVREPVTRGEGPTGLSPTGRMATPYADRYLRNFPHPYPVNRMRVSPCPLWDCEYVTFETATINLFTRPQGQAFAYGRDDERKFFGDTNMVQSQQLPAGTEFAMSGIMIHFTHVPQSLANEPKTYGIPDVLFSRALVRLFVNNDCKCLFPMIEIIQMRKNHIREFIKQLTPARLETIQAAERPAVEFHKLANEVWATKVFTPLAIGAYALRVRATDSFHLQIDWPRRLELLFNERCLITATLQGVAFTPEHETFPLPRSQPPIDPNIYSSEEQAPPVHS